MANQILDVQKVIGSLPSVLAPNTFYAVRVGTGYDLYLSDATGMVAHRLNPNFEGLAVGGRNLLLNTKTLHALWTRPTSIDDGVATFVGNGRLLASIQQSDNLHALDNGKVTISFTAKSNQNGRLHIRLRRFNASNKQSDIAQYVTIDSRAFKRYSLALDYAKWNNQDRVNVEIATYEQAGFVCEVKLPKLEIGNLDTCSRRHPSRNRHTQSHD